jgi:hypothetical protein
MKKKKLKDSEKFLKKLMKQSRGVTISSGTVGNPQYAITCNLCYAEQWAHGIGGSTPMSMGEVMVSAYANGWYLASQYVGPKCIDAVIAHREQLKEYDTEECTNS